MMWYEKPLTMSVAEICKEYREAKNPDKQIDILADLNDTKSTRIAWILTRAGYDVPYRRLPRAPRVEDGVDLEVIWSGYPEALEADAIRAERPEPSEKPVEKKPVEKKPVDDILAELWTVYLGGVRFRKLDGMDVRAMMSLRDIAELIGGIGE